MARDQIPQLELAFGIEAAGRGRDFLPQKPVCADDPPVVGAGKRRIEYQEMVADLVETVDVAPRRRIQIGLRGPELVVEDAVADFLCGSDFGGIAGKAHFQCAYASKGNGRENAFRVAIGEHGRCNVQMSVTIRQSCLHG